MLEHQKIVLKGVGDNKVLFRKELIKSISWLEGDDLALFRNWVGINFSHMHPEIIQEVLHSAEKPSC